VECEERAEREESERKRREGRAYYVGTFLYYY
jgi:hypothetical protein